jgi:hypothetical protein
MKGMDTHLLVIMIGVVFMVIAIIVLWAFLSGYLKFGVKLTDLTMTSLRCGICKSIPAVMNLVCSGGC